MCVGFNVCPELVHGWGVKFVCLDVYRSTFVTRPLLLITVHFYKVHCARVFVSFIFLYCLFSLLVGMFPFSDVPFFSEHA